MVLHAVREMACGMRETGQLASKSRGSVDRIIRRVNDEIKALPPISEADARAFIRAADTLLREWKEDEQMSRQAFVCVALTIIADFRAGLPPKAFSVAKACEDIESMLFTLYGHFDADQEDEQAMDQGVQISNEYRAVVAAV